MNPTSDEQQSGVECPYCQSLMAAIPPQVFDPGEKVRCDACFRVFDAKPILVHVTRAS